METQIFVHPDQLEAFHSFESNLRRELQPSGELQHHLFLQFLHAAWNVRRTLALEIAVQNEAIAAGLADALLDDDLARKLDRIDRHKRQYESAQRAALKELRQLQAEALFRQTIDQFDGEPILTPTAKVLSDVHRAAVFNHAQQRKAEFQQAQAKIETLVNAPPAPPAHHQRQ